MEESEKRRERLRAMRAEAAQADSSGNSATPAMATGCLANPLTEILPQEEPNSAPRFDFYTDPMSAFSDNRRKNHHWAPPPGIRNAGPPPPPPQVDRFQGNYYPDQQINQGRGFCHNPIPHRSPVGMSPFNNNQGNMDPSMTPGFSPSYNYNYQYPGPRGRFPSPGFSPTTHNASQAGGRWVNSSPRPGPEYRGSPNPIWGRGEGRWHGSGPSPGGSGRRGGRGAGPSGRSFTGRPLGAERFYNVSMIEDPWKFLEPVMWREVELPSSTKPWTPRSLTTKKAKVSDDSNKSGSQPSLAEYLAASFDEAVGDDALGTNLL